MNKVKVEKIHKKPELNPIREQALSFINELLPSSLDKSERNLYKKK